MLDENKKLKKGISRELKKDPTPKSLEEQVKLEEELRKLNEELKKQEEELEAKSKEYYLNEIKNLTMSNLVRILTLNF